MKFWILFTLLYLFISTCFSQTASKREWSIFQKGISDYKANNFQSAEEHFLLVIEKLPDSPLSTANHLMLAKSRYKLGKYDQSLADCISFLDTYRYSKYRDDVLYLKGNIYYKRGDKAKAISAWIDASENSEDNRLISKSLSYAEKTMRNELSSVELSEIGRNWPTGSLKKDMVQYFIADHAYRSGNNAKALRILRTMLQSSSTSIYSKKAEELQNKITFKRSNVLRIAALLPLSGANMDIGNALFKGIQLSMETFRTSHNLEIEIVPFDYGTRISTALKAMKDISADNSIIAVFGPVENDIAAACAVIADYEDITLISPTASSDEIMEISDDVVLLAPTVKSLAERLNKFAADSLKLNRIATISPLDDYFVAFTKSFTERHLEKKGEIVAEQKYYPGDVDFSRQFKILKRLGLKLEFQDSLLQIDSTLAANDIDSLYALHREEEMNLLEETKTKIDSADIPVITFDGLLVPIYKDDLSLIAPQIAYANFETQLLGNSDWYSMDDLKKNKNYINGIVFVTDGYLNEENWDYRKFRNNFRTRYRTTPEKFELIGYDSFNYFLNIFEKTESAVTRSNVMHKMKNLQPYRGIYRSFNLSDKSYNTAARILKYYYGQLIPLN
jgi:ABC-type branched-subunit amino acid transport system substrate-binding protein